MFGQDIREYLIDSRRMDEEEGEQLLLCPSSLRKSVIIYR